MIHGTVFGGQVTLKMIDLIVTKEYLYQNIYLDNSKLTVMWGRKATSP